MREVLTQAWAAEPNPEVLTQAWAAEPNPEVLTQAWAAEPNPDVLTQAWAAEPNPDVLTQAWAAEPNPEVLTQVRVTSASLTQRPGTKLDVRARAAHGGLAADTHRSQDRGTEPAAGRRGAVPRHIPRSFGTFSPAILSD